MPKMRRLKLVLKVELQVVTAPPHQVNLAADTEVLPNKAATANRRAVTGSPLLSRVGTDSLHRRVGTGSLRHNKVATGDLLLSREGIRLRVGSRAGMVEHRLSRGIRLEVWEMPWCEVVSAVLRES
jgi:hypothetical protein